jgi:(5-formylfuran-3-yl)methyl phosphate synthase
MTDAALHFKRSMFDLSNNLKRPGLLVSVRNADEAIAALAGGADVIDVKEPDRGALGAADAATIAAVVRAVNERLPVTAAMGELADLYSGKGVPVVPAGVALFKIGLAGCGRRNDWQSLWRGTVAALADSSTRPRPVAVAYADWRLADAPEPGEILNTAVATDCPALLVDTWDKSAGNLFDHWPAEKLCQFVCSTRSRGLIVVLAGSLQGDSLEMALQLSPDVVAVRGAACIAGRRGTVSRQRVAALKKAVRPVLRCAMDATSHRPEIAGTDSAPTASCRGT